MHSVEFDVVNEHLSTAADEPMFCLELRFKFASVSGVIEENDSYRPGYNIFYKEQLQVLQVI